MKFQQRVGALVVSTMTYTKHRLSEDRGEGVISTAIVVMIVAFLAALMWVGFKAIWGRTETSVNTSINTVGN